MRSRSPRRIPLGDEAVDQAVAERAGAGVSFSIALGLNAGKSGMRAGRCSGGSDVIGGDGITGLNFFSRTITRREEKCSVS